MSTIPSAVSAGGVIVKTINDTPHILLIRNKKYNDWIMPKGHVEAGETLEEAAIREISEEAGINDISVGQLLGTYERYVEKAKENKTINYFLVTAGANIDPNKDLSTEQDEIKWFPLNNLPPFFLKEQQDVIDKNKHALEKIKTPLR